MPKTLVALSVAFTTLAACHPPPPKQQSSVDQFTAPAPAGHEEKWVEPEPEEKPKPPEPPPPPTPTSPPPEGGLGYAFGLTKAKAVGICSQHGTWSKKGGTSYACSKPAEGAAFPGKPLVSFCDDKVCAVGVAIVVETGDWEAWKTRFEEMKKALVDAHGAPTVDTLNVDAKCQNEGFSKCLDEGTANAETTWQWKEGHRVSLTMGKKKSGEGPAAIRFLAVSDAGK